MYNNIKPLSVRATIKIPYVDAEGITTLEILKQMVSRLNEIIDYVNTLPTFEDSVNSELINLSNEITKQLNDLRNEINTNFGTNFETSLQNAIDNGTFDEMLAPLNSNVSNLQSRVSILESKVTLLETEISKKINDAPIDNKTYGRKNASWVEVGSGGEGISDAPVDGKLYGRENASWKEIGTPSNMMTLDTAQTVTALKTFNITPQSSNMPTLDNELTNKAYVDNNLGLKTLVGTEENPYNLRNITRGIYKLINTYVTIDNKNPVLMPDGIYVTNRLPSSSTINITHSDPYILTLLSYSSSYIGGQTPSFRPYLIYVNGKNTSISMEKELNFGDVINTNDSQTITGTKTFVSIPNCSATPTSNNNLTNKAYVDNAVLNAPIPNNMMTLDTAQTVHALKTFTNLPVSDNTPLNDNEFTNKAYVDNAISNHASEAESKIGDLNNLNTTDKTNIVSAINEVNTNTNNLSESVSSKITGITNNSRITRGTSAPSGGNDGDIYFLYS